MDEEAVLKLRIFLSDADWSKTEFRGENTCFSGIGGLNCQSIVNSVITTTGRIGHAWDRALFYAEG